MHNDFHPYYAPYCDNRVVTTDYGKDASDWMVPMEEPWASGIIEIPGIRLTRSSMSQSKLKMFCFLASWALDDWPPFNPDPSRPGSVS